MRYCQTSVPGRGASAASHLPQHPRLLRDQPSEEQLQGPELLDHPAADRGHLHHLPHPQERLITLSFTAPAQHVQSSDSNLARHSLT